MRLKGVFSALASLFVLAGNLLAATHTWTGAVSSLWSNNANWTGGTPAGDPNADVVFPNVANKVSTNDMGVVFLRSISFEASGYVVNGTAGSAVAVSESITWPSAIGTNTISLPIQIPTSLSVFIPSSQAGATLVLSGAISGGELNISAFNLPTVLLTGNNTNSSTRGTYYVRLIVTGSQPQTPFTVSGNYVSVLGGTGTIGPLSLSYAHLEPGVDGPGILTVQGDSILGNGSELEIDIAGPAAGTGYDRLALVGSLDLAGNLGFSPGASLDVSAPYAASPGETFTIITTTGTLSGTFRFLPDGTVVPFDCQNFRVNYTSNSVVLTRVAGGGPPLSSVEISVDVANVCTNSSGGTATVTDVGGCTTTHQWGFRTVSGGAITPIPGATGTTYVIDGSDFPAVGTYYLVATTTPQFGNPMTSNERTMNVVPPPTAVAAGSATIPCGGSAMLSGSGAASCSWLPTSGLNDPNSCSPLASPDVTTTYSLTVSGAGGCTSTNTAQVTVTVDPACPSPGLAFYTIAPCRVVDTRQPGGAPALPGGSESVFSVAGACGIPPGAKALALNVTVVKPSSDGFLTLYAAGAPRPLASTLNYRAGQVRANNATVPLSQAGGMAVFCGGAGAYDLLVDVSGYYQ